MSRVSELLFTCVTTNHTYQTALTCVQDLKTTVRCFPRHLSCVPQAVFKIKFSDNRTAN